MESNYRNNNNNQLNHSGYPNTANARGSHYVHSNTNNKNQKKKNRNNENKNLNNANRYQLKNQNQPQHQQLNQHYPNQETHSLPQSFINSYVSNVPMPLGFNYDLSSSFDSSVPFQQQQQQQQHSIHQNYLVNRNRSPNKNNIYRYNSNNRNKKFSRSTSNHNMQDKTNNSFEYSPKKGLKTSPSDSTINTHLLSSDEFNNLFNNLKTSPKKLTSFVEESKLVITTAENSVNDETIKERCINEILITTTIQENNINKQETNKNLEVDDVEMNSTVVNTLNGPLENSASQMEKEYEFGIKSADQSELSENQYFSANETNQAQSSSSSGLSGSPSSPSNGGSLKTPGSSSSTSYVTNDDDSLIKYDDTANKTINNDTINNTNTEMKELLSKIDEGEINSVIHSNIDYIESEGDYNPRLKVNNDDDVEEGLKKASNDETNNKEIPTMDNSNLADDSIDSTESAKTITSNISDIEIETGTSKSSEYSDLENLKIRTIDIESDESLCNSSVKSNENSEKQEDSIEINNGNEIFEFRKENLIEDKFCEVDNSNFDKIIETTETIEESLLAEELKEIVERIVTEVITNAVSVLSEPEKLISNTSSFAQEITRSVSNVVENLITNEDEETLIKYEYKSTFESVTIKPENQENQHVSVTSSLFEHIETEKILVNVDNVEDNEIINTKIQEIEPLKTDYRKYDDDDDDDDNDFDMCHDSDLDKFKQEQQELYHKSLNGVGEDNSIIDMMKDEINLDQFEKLETKTDVNDPLRAIHADDSDNENLNNIKNDDCQSNVKNLTSSQMPEKKANKKVATTSEVDCFGCNIL